MKHLSILAFLASFVGAMPFSALADQPSDHLVLEARGEPNGKQLAGSYHAIARGDQDIVKDDADRKRFEEILFPPM